MPEDIDYRTLCADCIGDAFLKLVVTEDGIADRCSYCSGEGPALPTSWVSDHVYDTFQRVLLRARLNMESFVGKSGSEMFSEFECDGVPNVDAIIKAVNIPEKAAKDIHDVLKNKHVKRPVR